MNKLNFLKVMIKNFLYVLAMNFLLPQTVLASRIDLPPENYGLPTTEGKGLPAIISNAIGYTAGLAATVAVVAFIVGAIMYAVAGGEDEKVGKAKKVMIWTVVGLLIAIFSWSIVNILLTGTPISTAPTS